MRGYFVTGTDTNVGKTYVACTLARRAVARGHRVFAFKPIESGCERAQDGHFIGADQELLVTAAGGWQLGPHRGLYQFPLPAAPLVAANAAATSIDLDFIVQTARAGAAQGDASLTIVEGAGGWRVPITEVADMSTLAQRLDLPVIIVARAGLGTINHTLLTVEAVQRDGVQIAAVVLSQRADDVGTESNRHEIGRRWPGQVLVLGAAPAALDPLIEPA